MSVSEVFSIHSYHGYILQLLLAELLFVGFYKRRGFFLFRAIGALICYVLFSIVLTNLLNFWVTGLASLTIFLISYLCLLFCFENKPKDLLFFCVGAQLIQNLSHNIENLIYLPLASFIPEIGDFFLSVVVRIIVYSLCFLIIKKKADREKGVSLSSGGVFPIAISSALFCYFVQFLLQVYQIDTLWVTRLPLVFSDIIALLLQFGLLGYKNKRDENASLEKLISQSDDYYRIVKENTDILNRKAHDLKHFIHDFRRNRNLSDEELKDLQDTLEKYESSPRTGNKSLDRVLSEKSYLCHKKQIPFYIRAKDNLLPFVRPGDRTSLFGNLLSNAIECEEKIQDASKRFILLKIAKKGQIVSVHVENYCDREVRFKNGLPRSTKGDENFHGFGTKSIAYIVKKYDGNLRFSKENDIYSADIIIPYPKERKEK